MKKQKKSALPVIIACIVVITALSLFHGCGVALYDTAAKMSSITVAPQDVKMAVGGIKQFTATGTLQDGSTKDVTNEVTWSSSNPVAATIDPGTGVAAGNAAGTTTISASSDGVSGSATVNVVNATLQSIAVTPATATIGLNATKQFTAIGTYSDGSGNFENEVAATWSSSNTAIASVDSKGLATGLADGTATITASKSGKTGTATLTVNSTVKTITAVTVNPGKNTPYNMKAGDSQQFNARATYSDGTSTPVGQNINDQCSWSSSNTNVATVNDTDKKGYATVKQTALLNQTADIIANCSGVQGKGTIKVSTSTGGS